MFGTMWLILISERFGGIASVLLLHVKIRFFFFNDKQQIYIFSLFIYHIMNF